MGWLLDLDMKQYYVYVIELDEKVTTHKKFRLKNPNYIRGNGCVYVGQSARKPEIRFEQHKEGYKANYFAKLYGIKLLPVFYKNITLYLLEKMQRILNLCSGKH